MRDDPAEPWCPRLEDCRNARNCRGAGIVGSAAARLEPTYAPQGCKSGFSPTAL